MKENRMMRILPTVLGLAAIQLLICCAGRPPEKAKDDLFLMVSSRLSMGPGAEQFRGLSWDTKYYWGPKQKLALQQDGIVFVDCTKSDDVSLALSQVTSKHDLCIWSILRKGRFLCLPAIERKWVKEIHFNRMCLASDLGEIKWFVYDMQTGTLSLGKDSWPASGLLTPCGI